MDSSAQQRHATAIESLVAPRPFFLSIVARQENSKFLKHVEHLRQEMQQSYTHIFFFKENENLHPEFYIGVLLILLAVALQMFRIYKEQRKLKMVKTGILN